MMSGYHGRLAIVGQKFSAPVVIAPAPGEVAHVNSIMIRDSKNFVIQGLKVWATSANAGTGAMIRSYSDSSDLAFADLDVRSVSSAGDYLQWSATDWGNNRRNGMLIAGDRVTIARNRVTGIYHGIDNSATNSLMEQNIVDGFAGDGMRSNGNNSIVRRNKVQNCVQIDGNHSDGFQAFSLGPNGPGSGTLSDLTIEDNKIFEWVASSTSPIKCTLQGIAMFDGMYDRAIIRNNVIAVSNYHGLTVAGALNTIVANNTVVHPSGVAGKRPWIKISNHKNGTPPQNVTVANNMANNYHVTSDPSRNILGTNNLIVSNAANEFVSFAAQNFKLKSTSQGVDAGNSHYAPSDDIVGTSRPLGKAPDAGAYENF
ncbi:choice-of-anchor Q domain-containing protein [Defluviimonas aestuarii]|uniref:choice-of-anchor Q domain-containing protein n=1 Tax=Albidovulum aestuarii TaxID=1130726 RepID=UPI00249C8516|nr:choice-of-anchor Q domain-containing protein [Defluviimonas aestuarii]MDI3338675.1 choice-of-anchor Q domain-containing protein [Defluviimonas aestuarii]